MPTSTDTIIVGGKAFHVDRATFDQVVALTPHVRHIDLHADASGNLVVRDEDREAFLASMTAIANAERGA